MAEYFNPAAKALELDELAKTIVDNKDNKIHPIESSAIFTAADQKMPADFAELKANPEHLAAVGKELEKLQLDTWSTMPSISIEATNGTMTSITFKPSHLDRQGSARNGYSIDLNNIEAK